MHSFWEQRMDGENHTFRKGGQMWKASYAQVYKCIVFAWEKIPGKIVQNSFKKSEIVQSDIDDVQSNLTSNPDCFLDSDNNDADDFDFMCDDHNLSPEIIKFFTSNTENEDFGGFSDVQKNLVFYYIFLFFKINNAHS